jgi:hypothetical protein
MIQLITFKKLTFLDLTGHKDRKDPLTDRLHQIAYVRRL